MAIKIGHVSETFTVIKQGGCHFCFYLCIHNLPYKKVLEIKRAGTEKAWTCRRVFYSHIKQSL